MTTNEAIMWMILPEEDERQHREYAEGAWQPGDPIYYYPEHGDAQVVRPLFQVVVDDEYHIWHNAGRAPNIWRCSRCVVTWHDSAGKKCWSCGRMGDLPPEFMVDGLAEGTVRRGYAMLSDGPCRGRVLAFPHDELPPRIYLAAPVPLSAAALAADDARACEVLTVRRYVYEPSRQSVGSYVPYRFIGEE